MIESKLTMIQPIKVNNIKMLVILLRGVVKIAYNGFGLGEVAEPEAKLNY